MNKISGVSCYNEQSQLSWVLTHQMQVVPQMKEKFTTSSYICGHWSLINRWNRRVQTIYFLVWNFVISSELEYGWSLSLEWMVMKLFHTWHAYSFSDVRSYSICFAIFSILVSRGSNQIRQRYFTHIKTTCLMLNDRTMTCHQEDAQCDICSASSRVSDAGVLYFNNETSKMQERAAYIGARTTLCTQHASTFAVTCTWTCIIYACSKYSATYFSLLSVLPQPVRKWL